MYARRHHTNDGQLIKAYMNIVETKKNDLYQQRVRSEFQLLKSIDRYDESVAHSIRLPDNKGYLLCVSEFHTHDNQLISTLAKWRAQATTFHNKFEVTLESTNRWLRKLLLDVPDRILFIVVNTYGYRIGHMGFANALNNDCIMEFDNVIRGAHGRDKGIMSCATKALLSWANDKFEPELFKLRTLEDNEHAISFYQKLGFRIDGKQPLRRIESNGEINHVPSNEGDSHPPDSYFTCMRLNPADIELFCGLKN